MSARDVVVCQCGNDTFVEFAVTTVNGTTVTFGSEWRCESCGESPNVG